MCVCLLITVMFADNTVCVLSFRVECVLAWHWVHPLPSWLWPLTALQVVLLTLRWRHRCAESGLSPALRVRGERTGGRPSCGGRLSGCSLELLEASVCMTVLQCGFTCCEFPSVYLWDCVWTLYTCLLDGVTGMKRICLNVKDSQTKCVYECYEHL